MVVFVLVCCVLVDLLDGTDLLLNLSGTGEDTYAEGLLQTGLVCFTDVELLTGETLALRLLIEDDLYDRRFAGTLQTAFDFGGDIVQGLFSGELLQLAVFAILGWAFGRVSKKESLPLRLPFDLLIPSCLALLRKIIAGRCFGERLSLPA